MHLVEVELDHGDVCPMIPTHEAGADAFEIGQGDGDFHGPRAGHMGVGQDQPVGGDDHARADAAREALGTVLQGALAHVDADHGIEEAVEAAAHARPGGAGGQQNQGGDGGPEEG